ncbi:hypothetical protein ES703_76108 [subsurface metagenome]
MKTKVRCHNVFVELYFERPVFHVDFRHDVTLSLVTAPLLHISDSLEPRLIALKFPKSPKDIQKHHEENRLVKANQELLLSILQEDVVPTKYEIVCREVVVRWNVLECTQHQ